MLVPSFFESAHKGNDSPRSSLTYYRDILFIGMGEVMCCGVGKTAYEIPQSRIVPSEDAEARIEPSGVISTLFTVAVCPASV
jgi:hypothetical protein